LHVAHICAKLVRPFAKDIIGYEAAGNEAVLRNFLHNGGVVLENVHCLVQATLCHCSPILRPPLGPITRGYIGTPRMLKAYTSVQLMLWSPAAMTAPSVLRSCVAVPSWYAPPSNRSQASRRQ